MHPIANNAWIWVGQRPKALPKPSGLSPWPCPKPQRLSERRFRRTNLANDTCLWEPKLLLLLRFDNRAAGACIASSPESDLEAFSHNPAHGRADIEGSKSNVASDTSSFKFQRSKGSIGHAFTVRIRTENQNQTSFYPCVPQQIYVLVKLILGHLRYLLKMCRPSQTPHLTMSSTRIDSPKQALGLKEGVVTPPPIHGVSKITSELAVRRPRKDTERTVPSPSPGRHESVHSHHVNGSSSPPRIDGFRTGTPEPSPQRQSFFRSYGSIFPNSLAYIIPSTRRSSPWRPNAVMSTTGGERHSVLWIFKGRRNAPDTTRRAVLFQPLDPTSC
ncbi:hypothetical protein Bca4012_052245 [Brassica carinata]